MKMKCGKRDLTIKHMIPISIAIGFVVMLLTYPLAPIYPLETPPNCRGHGFPFRWYDEAMGPLGSSKLYVLGLFLDVLLYFVITFVLLFGVESTKKED